MKQRKINLLTYKEDRRKVLHFFQLLRTGTLVYSIFISIFLLVFFFINRQTSTQIDELTQRKDQLLASITSASKNEASLIYVSKKTDFAHERLSEDVVFFPYYNIVKEGMVNATGAATLESFEIDKDLKAHFVVSIPDFSQIVSYLRRIETNQFLNHFETFTLSSFASDKPIGTEGANNRITFKLAFDGKFNKIQ